MRKFAVWLGLALLALVGVVTIALMAWEPTFAETSAPPPKARYTAEIIRDEWGVPHIHGKRDVDVAYGVAIAHSQDDFSTLQDVIAMTRGRYGAIAGEDGAAFDYALHLLGARETVERHYAALPADVRGLLDAYATGLNDYAADHPREVKLGNLFPVNGQDVATGFALRQPFFFGLGDTIGPLVKNTEADPEPGRPTGPTPLPTGEEAQNLGSNAFAIAPSRDPDGVTRLVSNSHQPWRGGVAWYEMVVESDEGWHFAGANFPGSPFPFLGHNETLGWTNTVNHPDMVDVYELTVTKEVSGADQRWMYQLDGKWLPLEHEVVTLPVRFGPLVLPIRRDVYRSQHGPVIHNDKGWFAIRYGGIDSIDQLDAYYRLNKAKDFAEWKAILAEQKIPSTNFVYADAAGNIAYFYNAAIPQRQAGPNWRHVLPGNDSSLIWNSLVPFSSLPQYVNPKSGWLFNSNNNPFVATGATDNLRPEDFPAEMGIETKMTNRAYRAFKLLSEANVIDRPTLERIKYDTGWEDTDYVKQTLDGIAALDVASDPVLREGQQLLGQWDFQSDGKNRADALALLVLRKPMGDSYNGRALTPPRWLLTFATTYLMDNFGRLDPPLEDILRVRQGPGDYAVDLPMDGGSDTLRAATLWDYDADGKLSVRHGDSFVMFVEWAPGKRVSSQSIMPFGAATTRPGNVHYTDQAALFVEHKLKPVHFWREDLAANTDNRQVVTSR